MTEHRYSKNGQILLWFGSRPDYCDRGRWDAHTDLPVFISDAEWFPRYYFNLKYGKEEMLRWLISKKVDCTNGKWEIVEYCSDGQDIVKDGYGPTPETLPELE